MKLKICLFITSFLPLWISIIFMNIWKVLAYINEKADGKLKKEYFSYKNILKVVLDNKIEFIFSMILFILFCYSAYNLYIFLKENERSSNNPLGKIVKVSRAHNLGSDFLVAYILPMIAFDFSSLRDVILFSLIFITLGFLCIRNENVYTNIFLELVLRYQMFYVDLEKDSFEENGFKKENILFLSKCDLRMEINRKISYYEMTNYIYINLGEENVDD